MSNYLTEEQRNDLLRKLNACYTDYHHWSTLKAQKKHVDLFGDEICQGDYYYRSRVGPDFSSDLKLSIRSMDQFLYGIFANGPRWEEQAEKIIADKQDHIRSIIEKLQG